MLIPFAVVAAFVLSAFVAPPAVEAAVPKPSGDPFYSYTDSTPLQGIKPGTVLKTRSLPYHIVGLALPLKATQLLYRSTDAQDRPTVNVTSVIAPLANKKPAQAIAY